MKAIESQRITTFSFDDSFPGFRVDVVERSSNVKERLYEAWLYHNNYGIKTLMFGALEDSMGVFLEMIDNNIADYIEDYIEDYIKEK